MSGVAALAGIQVLDLCENHTAYAARLLADLGATVIRVEPVNGSALRRGDGLEQNSDASAHEFLNAGKQSVVVNPGEAPDRVRLAKLVSASDILFHSSGSANAIPMSPSELVAANPRLIVVSISPFGLEGPYSGYAGGDLTTLAAGGLLSLGGYADSEPIGVKGNLAETGAGIFAAAASLAALYDRETSGKGAWIDVSGQECVAFALEDAVPEWYVAHRVRRRLGEEAREAGTGVYPCRDGYVSLVAGRLGTAKAFVTLTRWIAESGVEGGASLLDPKWQDFRVRQSAEGVAEFAKVFGVFCSTRTKDELYREGQARQIAIAPVNSVADLFDNAQLQQSDFFRPLADDGGPLFPRSPYRLSRTPACPRGAAPDLGAHNNLVFGT